MLVNGMQLYLKVSHNTAINLPINFDSFTLIHRAAMIQKEQECIKQSILFISTNSWYFSSAPLHTQRRSSEYTATVLAYPGPMQYEDPYQLHNINSRCANVYMPVLFGVLLSDCNLQQYIGKRLAQMYTIDNEKETITILWYGE